MSSPDGWVVSDVLEQLSALKEMYGARVEVLLELGSAPDGKPLLLLTATAHPDGEAMPPTKERTGSLSEPVGHSQVFLGKDKFTVREVWALVFELDERISAQIAKGGNAQA